MVKMTFTIVLQSIEKPIGYTLATRKVAVTRPFEDVMIENQKIKPAQVIGPLGEPLTLDNLPAPGTKRWVVRRKAEVVAAVNVGLLTIDEECERYDLTLEEFASWQRAVDRSGMPGLRVTRIQHYRDLYERQQRY